MPSAKGLLEAIIAREITFWADISLRPGKLNEQDAQSLRRVKAHIDDSLQRLHVVLSRVAPEDAAEIERLLAQIVNDAGKAWHLLPIPSPNARDAVAKQEARRRGKKANAGSRTTRARIANEEAFEKVRPINFNGKNTWTVAGQVLKAMQQELIKRPGKKVKCIGQRAVYDKLVAIKIS